MFQVPEPEGKGKRGKGERGDGYSGGDGKTGDFLGLVLLTWWGILSSRTRRETQGGGGFFLGGKKKKTNTVQIQAGRYGPETNHCPKMCDFLAGKGAGGGF